jgi:hypothetical protein
MKRLLLFIFSIFFLGSSLVYAENIVINTKGESVLLKDDGTWVVIFNEGEEGKLVFLIRKATDLHLSYDKKDDMDEFSHYMNLVGCSYTVEVINKTDFKIKINNFTIGTNNKKLFDSRFYRDDLLQFGEVIKPGESYLAVWDRQIGGPLKQVDDTKELATEEQINEWLSTYGCEAQRGSIFISTYENSGDITFSKDSGIADEAKGNFIIGSPNGIYPLIEKINL